ncbi:hypothetical protein B0T19DRAFT_443502 [Cercophora scortea]|uniref:DUF7730 domain-containing protein n=1 Tax=Cercophora scortea TaxID=314031 RepID=A0AAE0MA15_9PEZI|nr:hypothetical protein B0T19DRAFT_443502 [Cercophora scortea]
MDDFPITTTTADPQTQSPFFKLPAEIRESIYIELWRATGSGSLRYHILTRDDDGTQRLAHRPCIVASLADEEDKRLSVSHRDFAPGSPELERWRTSLRYTECIPSIYASPTFIFTDLLLANRFLSQHQHSPIRSLELCIRASNLLTELYYPVPLGSESILHLGPAPAFPGRPALSVDNNPWAHVCDLLLARDGELRDLCIWLDSSDLRPWQDRVSETRLFAKLCGVRLAGRKGKGGGGFMLMLPDIPGPESRRLGEEHFLEGERVREMPFVVVRGPRVNNWRAHLAGFRRVGVGAVAP